MTEHSPPEVTKSDRLPKKSEIRCLTQRIEKELEDLVKCSKSRTAYSQYLHYCKFLITRIVVYNIKQSGEVAAMAVKQFAHHCKGMESCFLLPIIEAELFIMCPPRFPVNSDELLVNEMIDEERQRALSISNVSLRG